MVFPIQNRRVTRRLGLCLAAAVFCASAVSSRLSAVENGEKSIVTERAVSRQTEKTQQIETVSVPIYETIRQNSRADSEKIHEVYEKIVQTQERRKQEEAQGSESDESVTASTTVLSPSDIISTTAGTTADGSSGTTSETARRTTQTTQTLPGDTVSNGQLPFNYHDVSSIGSDLSTLEDFVTALDPVSFSWDTGGYAASGYVKISLASPSGSVTLEVKPCRQDSIDACVIEGDVRGSVNVTSLDGMEWYRENRGSGACICSVTWLRPDYPLEPVRGVGVGASLGKLTANYLCVNGGGTTLYKAADVILDENKLNALAVAENLYTFVGGRLYTMEGYLKRYYSDAESAYLFEDCDMVVQYGCNSIMDHNYTTGSWLMEYAVKDDTVEGIVFLNKSYYNKTSITGGGSTSSHTDQSKTQTGSKETSGTSGTVTEETTSEEPETVEQSEDNSPTTETSDGTANVMTAAVKAAEDPSSETETDSEQDAEQRSEQDSEEETEPDE